jgi:hypothetical protein
VGGLPAKLAEREHHIRESWVKAMEARLVREELEKCQRTEGVNHYETCKWLSDKYLTMLKENKVCVNPDEKIYNSVMFMLVQVKGYKTIDL